MRGGRAGEEALAELDADQRSVLRGRAPRPCRGSRCCDRIVCGSVEPGLWNWLSKARIAARRVSMTASRPRRSRAAADRRSRSRRSAAGGGRDAPSRACAVPRRRRRPSRAGRRGGGRVAVVGVGRQDEPRLLAADDVDDGELLLAAPAAGRRRRGRATRGTRRRGSRRRAAPPPRGSPPCRACPSRRASGPRCRTGSRAALSCASVPPQVSSTSSGMRGDRENVNRHGRFLLVIPEIHDGDARGRVPAARRRRCEHAWRPQASIARERRIDPLGRDRRPRQQRPREALAPVRRSTSLLALGGLARAVGELLELVGDLLRRASRARPRATRRAPRAAGPSAARLSAVASASARHGVGLRARARPAAAAADGEQVLLGDAELFGQAPLGGPAQDDVRARQEHRRRDPEEREERKALRVVRDLRRPENARRHGEEIRLQDRAGL